MIYPSRTHLLDTSAMIKLVLNEVGSSELKTYISKNSTFWTTSVCFGEALGILKVEHFHRKNISKKKYLASVEVLVSYLKQKISIQEVNIADRQIYSKIEDTVKKHLLDFADAIQLVTLTTGFPSVFEGESKTIFITGDKKLAIAATNEKIRVWNIVKEPCPPPIDL